MKNNNTSMKLILVQQHNLKNIFDLDDEYFTQRKNLIFFEDIHYFPQSKSKTKKVVLWDVTKTFEALTSRPATSIDSEVEKLLRR